jgi:hypothetical protein
MNTEKEGQVKKARSVIRQLMLLCWSLLRTPQLTSTLASKMNELNTLYVEFKTNCATNWVGFNPPSKAAQTRLANDMQKVMKELAKEIIQELSKIDCSCCGLGNVLPTDLCNGRKVGSGFEIMKMQKSPKASRVWVVDSHQQWCNDTWEWLPELGHYEWGMLNLPAQGTCTNEFGPHPGSDRPMQNALEHLDGESAKLIMQTLERSEIPRKVRIALNNLAEYETRVV